MKKEVVKAYNETNGNNESKKPTDYTINIFSEDTEPTKVTELAKTLKEAGMQVEVTKSVASTQYSIFGVTIEYIYKINVKANSTTNTNSGNNANTTTAPTH